MSSIFKGLNEAFDVNAMQAEYQQRKQDIEANAQAYSEKYGIPLDHKYFVGAVMQAQNDEETRTKQKARDEEAKLSAAKGVEADKANIDKLKQELEAAKAKLDPNFEYSDDHSYWSEQKRIQATIQGLEKRIKAASSVDEAKEADYGADYQDMVKRVGQLAKEGPRKTVWDPVKRVYKTVPVNPPKKEESVEEDLSRRDLLKKAGGIAAGLTAGGALAKGGGGGGGHGGGGHASAGHSGGRASGGRTTVGRGPQSSSHVNDAPHSSFTAGRPFVPVTGHSGTQGNDADKQEYIKFLTSFRDAIRAG